MERIRNYIRGAWVDSKSGETFPSVNPAYTEETIGIVAKSGREDVDDAVKAAREAYEGWRLTPAPRRGEALDTYSHVKVIYRDFSGRLQKAQIDKSTS